MQVIDFIKQHGIEGLKEFAINVGEYENLYVLNYDQIDSPKYHPIVKECRALILDKHTLKVLARSFTRFYNLGEDQENESKFKIENATCLEKIDGSLVSVWYYPYDNKWVASTRKMPFAEGTTTYGLNGSTFRDVINKSFAVDDVDTFASEMGFHKGLTYVFEVVSPETRIVTQYPEYKSFLLTVVDNETGYDHIESLDNIIPKNILEKLNLPKKYKFNTLTEILDHVKSLPFQDEGYVCHISLSPGNIYRIKIKNPAYVAIAHLRDNGCVSKKRICTIVFLNEEEEYLKYFPEDHQFFDPFIESRNKMYEEIDSLWLQTKDIENQKEFALKVKDRPYSHFLFNMRKGKTKQEIIDKMTDNTKVDVLLAMMK